MRLAILFSLPLLFIVSDRAEAQRDGYRGKVTEGEIISCSSERGGYRECLTGFRYAPDLVHQESRADCVEGETWGHRQGMVWVARGCRASFREGRPTDTGRSLVCESRRDRRTECPIPFRGRLSLVEQMSRAECIEGQTWGQTRNSIWVDRGCRARFAEGYSDSPGFWSPSSGQQRPDYAVDCASVRDGFTACPWDRNAGRPFLETQYSDAPCVRGRSWGWDDRRGLWVDQGCRGRFAAR